jgi:hypothetical protein
MQPNASATAATAAATANANAAANANASAADRAAITVYLLNLLPRLLLPPFLLRECNGALRLLQGGARHRFAIAPPPAGARARRRARPQRDAVKRAERQQRVDGRLGVDAAHEHGAHVHRYVVVGGARRSTIRAAALVVAERCRVHPPPEALARFEDIDSDGIVGLDQVKRTGDASGARSDNRNAQRHPT